MLVAGANSILPVHPSQLAPRVEDRDRVMLGHEELWRRQLMKFRLEYDFVDAAPALLADVHAAHERSQSLVPRTWRLVNESQRVDERFSRVCNLDAVREDFYRGACARTRRNWREE